MAIGQDVVRHLFVGQWEEIDWLLVDYHQQLFPLGSVRCDGYDTPKVASQLGIIHMPRKICHRTGQNSHTVPGNAILAAHGGMIMTRSLQEWACLLSRDLPFTTGQRLLGKQTHEAEILSATKLCQLVREHGQDVS